MKFRIDVDIEGEPTIEIVEDAVQRAAFDAVVLRLTHMEWIQITHSGRTDTVGVWSVLLPEVTDKPSEAPF